MRIIRRWFDVGGWDMATGFTGFGQQLRAWRARREISLRALARSVHVDYSYLSKVERGVRIAGRELAAACDAELGAGGALLMAWQVRESLAGQRPVELMMGVRHFVGRRQERELVAAYRAGLADGICPAIVIGGPPGVGKTSLAAHCAVEAIGDFPDGVLFADMRGHSDAPSAEPQEVLEQFLVALGFLDVSLPRTLEARASLFRSTLHGRRVLIVLDNVLDSEQVRPLLPAAPGCCVILTSRVRLSGLQARYGAVAVELEPLTPAESVAVLRGIIGGERVDAEPEAAAVLIRHCSYLPLALCVVAERVAARPTRMLTDFVEDLACAGEQLDVLTVTEDVSLEIRRVFSWSYRSLEPRAARLFRVLSLYCGDGIGLEGAAALAGCATKELARDLEVLLDAHLVRETEGRRYQLHHLLRLYAIELSRDEDGEEARRAARDRLLRWYGAAAHAASRAMAPYRPRPEIPGRANGFALPRLRNRDDAIAWFEQELPALVAVTEQALDSGLPEIAYEIPIAMWDFFLLRKPWRAWRRMNENGLSAAVRVGDVAARVRSLSNLGVAQLDLGDLDGAAARLGLASELGGVLGAPEVLGWSLLWLGKAELARERTERGAELLEQALAAFIDVEDRWAAGLCRGYLGRAYSMLGRFDEAEARLGECERELVWPILATLICPGLVGPRVPDNRRWLV